jgi:hypothetical protein
VPVASVDAGTANETIQALFDRFNGINGFDKNPNLDHIARFPVVRSFGEAGGDDDTGLILVDYKAVDHREPPSEMGVMDRSNLVGTGFPSPYLACALYLWPPT